MKRFRILLDAEARALLQWSGEKTEEIEKMRFNAIQSAEKKADIWRRKIDRVFAEKQGISVDYLTSYDYRGSDCPGLQILSAVPTYDDVREVYIGEERCESINLADIDSEFDGLWFAL